MRIRSDNTLSSVGHFNVELVLHDFETTIQDIEQDDTEG